MNNPMYTMSVNAPAFVQALSMLANAGMTAFYVDLSAESPTIRVQCEHGTYRIMAMTKARQNLYWGQFGWMVSRYAPTGAFIESIDSDEFELIDCVRFIAKTESVA